MVNGFASSHGDISGKVAFGRCGMRVKSGGIRVLTSPPFLFRPIESYTLPFRRKVAAPNAFPPPWGRLHRSLYDSSLVTGSRGNNSRACIKQFPSFASSTAGCRYILVEEYLSRVPPPGPIYRVPRKSREQRGHIFLAGAGPGFRASFAKSYPYNSRFEPVHV